MLIKILSHHTKKQTDIFLNKTKLIKKKSNIFYNDRHLLFKILT